MNKRTITIPGSCDRTVFEKILTDSQSPLSLILFIFLGFPNFQGALYSVERK